MRADRMQRPTEMQRPAVQPVTGTAAAGRWSRGRRLQLCAVGYAATAASEFAGSSARVSTSRTSLTG